MSWEGTQSATDYLVSEHGAKGFQMSNIQDCFSTFMDNW